MKYHMIYICFADYLELCKKGVAPQGILQRGDKDFFERFVNIHIGAGRTQIVNLDDSNVIYEFGIGASKTLFFSRFLQSLYAPFYLIRVIWNVYKIVKLERIDFIRGTDPYWCGFIALIVSRLAKIPFCISLHADYDQRGRISRYGASTTVLRSAKLGKLLSQFIFRKADMILPIRENLGELAVENGAKAEKIRVIPHGIDLNPFMTGPITDIYDYLGIERHLKIISFVGRLSKENYVDDVLRLSRLLGGLRTDFIVVIAGGGSEENRLRNIVNEDTILRKVIKMIGFQKQEICFDLRKSSAVSLCLMGGFSLIEACAAGRPVVSYDVEWHSELVEDNETGFLVREGDLEGLLKAVECLLDNAEDSNRMGRNAKKLAFERHNIQKNTVIKKRYYQELLKC
jgi:glycosyltransferase involved in cell wall biosynthesis